MSSSDEDKIKRLLNPFMHNVVKWPDILQKSCGVDTARFLKYVWPFYNIMHERLNNFHFIMCQLKKQKLKN